jgi:uncharacterized membrane protein YccC
VTPPTVTDRFLEFARRDLGVERDRVRYFARTLVALLLATVAIQVLRGLNGYWVVTFVLLVSSPASPNSEREAWIRILATLVGAALAAAIVIATYDLPWLYVPLQAIVLGTAIFIARATPIGAAALTAALTFAVVTGSSREVGATGFVDLAWVRLGLSVLGCGLAALTQLTLWQDDPLEELRRSLKDDLTQVEALVSGQPAKLRAGRLSRHFELLTNAEARDPALVRRRAAISLLILETEQLVDQAMGYEGVPAEQETRAAELLKVACANLRKRHEDDPFVPVPPPPPPRQPARLDLLSDRVVLIRRGGLKVALSAFLCLVIVDAIQFPASGALLVCIILGLQMSTGTDIAKPLTLLAVSAFGMLVVLLVRRLADPNVDDFGTYLIVVALAFTPTTWATVAGLRVRFPGLVGTTLAASGLFESYGPSDDLGIPATFLFTVTIGIVVVSAVDFAVWPVSRDRIMAKQLVIVMRSSAQLIEEPDPRIVLAPRRDPRWAAHRSLLAIANLRAEQVPAPGTAVFARQEEVLRLAVETLQWLVRRIEFARSEIAGDTTLEDTAEERRAWAETLRTRANRIDREGDVLALVGSPSPLGAR